MAKQSGLGQALYVHGYDLSGDVGAINTASGKRAALLDVTAIDKSAHERINGQADGELSFNCFFNDATDQEHDALAALPTADRLLMYLTGTARGDPAACLTAKQVNYDWARSQDGALLGTVQGLGQGQPLEWAELLVAKTTHASAADEASLDGGAQSTAGGVGYLQHFSGGSGTIEYDIEDSANDSTFANLLAFSDVATPYTQTAERVQVTGTVERYVRASTNGTFTNAEFAMAFRRGTAQDDVSLA